MKLTNTEINNASFKLDIQPEVLLAVIQVETNGFGFWNDGQIVILFERHIMYRQLKKHGLDPDQLMQIYPRIVNKKPGGYLGKLAEYQRLQLAKTIDEPSAIESTSYGLFQIMGFHWETLGYESAQDFERHLMLGENNQLEAFVRFIITQPTMHQALKNKEWARFARLYNGPQYHKNRYDLKLSDAFNNLIIE